ARSVARCRLAEWIRLHELSGFRVAGRDVLLELGPFDAPLAPATDLDGGQFAASYHVVDMRPRRGQLVRDILHGEEPRGHGRTIHPYFALVCHRLPARVCLPSGLE